LMLSVGFKRRLYLPYCGLAAARIEHLAFKVVLIPAYVNLKYL
jgi:hypothetical protein